jgi:hypothetical protein
MMNLTHDRTYSQALHNKRIHSTGMFNADASSMSMRANGHLHKTWLWRTLQRMLTMHDQDWYQEPALGETQF